MLFRVQRRGFSSQLKDEGIFYSVYLYTSFGCALGSYMR